MPSLGDEKKRTAAEKGNALEKAVGEIERVILSTTPTATEKPFTVEYKKIVVVGGVKHEIDIYVTVFFGPGYDAIFIFECKNWAAPVGKNEIIVFSEKIKAIGATHGYFVAKAFTEDARAQAEKDNRMTLRTATENDALMMSPEPGYIVRERVTNWQLEVTARDGTTLGETFPEKVTFGGAVTDSETLLREWSRIDAREKLFDFCSGKANGLYDFEYDFIRDFEPGAFDVYGKDIARIHIFVKAQVEIAIEPVESSFDIEGRGRVIRFAPVNMPGFISISESSVVLVDSENKTTIAIRKTFDDQK